jgi:kumamolisin
MNVLMKLAAASRLPAIAAWIVASSLSANVLAQTVSLKDAAPGTWIIPSSSIPRAVVPGQKAQMHTNIIIGVPGRNWKPFETPPYSGYYFETPESLGCRYLYGGSTGCNPNSTTLPPAGGSARIVIVDAYDDPNAASDLEVFDDQFGIAAATFTKVSAVTSNASCTTVPTDPTGGWEFEESLDIEYSHAMAPKAHVYLVEACSNNNDDLAIAIAVGNNIVQCGLTEIHSGVLGSCPAGSKGAGEISMSFGSSESSDETSTTSTDCASARMDDSCFKTPGVVYFASTGDESGVEYPSTSSSVVAVGGTTIRRNTSGDFLQETAWENTGGGVSAYEPVPSYQSGVSGVGARRSVPDVSLDADVNSGAWVYDSNYYEDFGEAPDWDWVGGTSLSAPIWAGIVNRAGQFKASSNAELTLIYSNLGNTADFSDIKVGFCGPYGAYSGVAGYDLCTGIGTPHSYAGK